MLVQSQLSVQLLYTFLVNYEQIFGPANTSLRNSVITLAQSREFARLNQSREDLREDTRLGHNGDEMRDNIIMH